MDVQQSLNNGIELIQNAIDGYAELADAKKDELQRIETNISTAEETLALLNDNIGVQRTATDEALSHDKKAIEETRLELIAVTSQLATAKVELESVTKKQTQFMQYQSRAQKMLQAREASILDKEEKLEEAIGLVKRRHSIIDNVL